MAGAIPNPTSAKPGLTQVHRHSDRPNSHSTKQMPASGFALRRQLTAYKTIWPITQQSLSDTIHNEASTTPCGALYSSFPSQ